MKIKLLNENGKQVEYIVRDKHWKAPIEKFDTKEEAIEFYNNHLDRKELEVVKIEY